jgi:hypothetical protein
VTVGSYLSVTTDITYGGAEFIEGVQNDSLTGAVHNDYALPTAHTRILRVTGPGIPEAELTGIVPTAVNQRITIINVGANDVRLDHQNTGSAAANRFINPSGADTDIPPDGAVTLWYDSTNSRWRWESKNF